MSSGNYKGSSRDGENIALVLDFQNITNTLVMQNKDAFPTGHCLAVNVSMAAIKLGSKSNPLTMFFSVLHTLAEALGSMIQTTLTFLELREEVNIEDYILYISKLKLRIKLIKCHVR